ncbi:MAG TPA: HAMP domain-containing sensor histidine kinase [Anaeromyxobacteraceae bacterium]|nr:HAMP domain-containing sensor histidine kinase [Anaeromyxobacteraceae bacterium]
MTAPAQRRVRGAAGRRTVGLRPVRADDMATPPPPGFDEIQRQELSRLFGRMVGARLVILPAVLALGTWAALADPAPWRRALLIPVLAALMAFFVFEAVRYRRRGFGAWSIPVNLGAGVLGQMLLTWTTGGLSSPLLPVAVLLALVSGIAVAPPLLLGFVAFQAAGVLALPLIEQSRWASFLHLAAFEPAWSSPARSWTAAALLAFLVVGGAGVGRAVRAVFDGMLRRALRAQHESLRLHGERVEELSALSAEIAHELKNPLASVKGLGGLLAPDVGGKAAERLGVLRREVDRMQSILDEFLNFSRPLVPLALGRVDLGTLAREVAALHEGQAHERGVSLSVRGEASGRCDPRKVKQVLVNLLQNAVEASPEGTEVEIEVGFLPAGGAALSVLDRGPGLDPRLGERVFEAGVTTKPRGSGIGLTVARALARQHGGEIALSPRPGGGLSAELQLPAAGEATPAAGVAAPARASGASR